MKRIFTAAVFAFLSACANESREIPVSLLGEPGSPDSANRVIEIDSDTDWVNVVGGDTVRFISGSKEFTWTFNVGMYVSSFELNRVAPAGMLDHPVRAYVEADPKYRGP